VLRHFHSGLDADCRVRQPAYSAPQGLCRARCPGKSSTGWFFGFNLHVVINHRGEILAIRLTPGNVDDRKPVPRLCQSLFGKLLGDKGYLA